MSIFSDIVVFQIFWWLVLFMVLPMGVKVDQEAAEKGFANSAPQNPGLKRKFLMTTAISIVLWAITHMIIAFELITL